MIRGLTAATLAAFGAIALGMRVLVLVPLGHSRHTGRAFGRCYSWLSSRGAYKLQEKAADIALNTLYLADHMCLLRARWQSAQIEQQIRRGPWQ